MRWMRRSVGVALLAASAVHAEPENITWGELALTHPICYHVGAIPLTGWSRIGRESPQSAHWNGLIGGEDMLWHMHHYCWALIHLRRAQAGNLPPHQRRYLIGVAIADFIYVVRQAQRLRQPSSFLLLPEILYRIGDAHLLVGETAQAIAAFEQSREVKPDYWPPYVAQAQLLEKVRMRKDALRLLERGLQIMPGEPNISAAFARLGGNPTSVRPLRPAALSATPTAAAASAPQ